ncbi:hypothetical protein [Longibacter sp.]|jgi:hypothetical protein|uniref:hypothetical protein n=1 Tax=Longibacter sp. TaxID=2045415 RepID=UPI003EC11A60
MSARRLSAFLLTLGFIVLVGTGCTPDPVYRLQSTVPDTTADWLQGRKYVTRSTDSLTVTMAYVRTTDDGHKFDVRIENRTRRTIIAEPSRVFADVYYMVPKPDTTVPPESFVQHRVWARNPEQALLAIDRQAEAVEADERTARGLYALESVADVAADAADGPDTDAEDEREATERLERIERRSLDQRRNLQSLNALERRRLRWAQTTLRRTTLPPRTGVEGYVYLPVKATARYLLVHVGPQKHRLRFPYRQEKYE